MHTSVIIPAAGLGKRIGSEIPKQYIEINDTPILIKTIQLFDNIDDVESIVVPVHSEWFAHTKELIEKFNCKKVKEITLGGTERQNSVFIGLQSKFVKDTEVVLIHDAVRPFVSQNLIQNLLNAADEYGAVIPAIKPNDTIKEINNKGFVEKTIDREKLIQVQTPEAFWTNLAIDAYEKAIAANFIGTDSSSLLEFVGYKVFIVEGEETNFKITTLADLKYAKMMIR
jgi:2-C-methyl-D-erythritol 4-phosphate cytidylyltransferase